ncbi:MAG: DoxX family protein [Prolixibacteraceae bacterium]|nr:DoxX family protein [Prolixibacteraceae bacterium]
MNKSQDFFNRADKNITQWMAKYGLLLLRLSIGIVFFWFGILKFIPGLSPAQDLAIRTIDLLSFGLIPGNLSINLLAAWEVVIGIGLLSGVYMRTTLLLLFLQMIGTMTPVFLFPSEVFTKIPYAPTLEGQYIIKNLVIISAGFVLGTTVRKRSRSTR